MGRQSSVRPDGSETGQALSRRRVFGRAAGLAALGAAGGSVLSQAGASPALAADGAVTSRQARTLAGQRAATAGTTVEAGAVAPAVVALADAATIAVDASLGNDFRVTLGANRTLGNPANPTDGQKITFQITQGSAGSATLTWGSAYSFATGLPQPTLSTAAGLTDLLAFIYNADKGKWLLAAYVTGFSQPVVVQQPNQYRLFGSTAGPAARFPTPGPSRVASSSA